MEKKVWMLLAVLFMCVGLGHAELHDRSCGLLYDDVLDITWLQDANYASTKQYDADGQMTWQQAKGWAEDLRYYDQCRGVWYDSWRLPEEENIDGTGPDKGRVRTSELGHMFYTNLQNSFLSWPAKDYQVNSNGSRTWIKNMQKTGEYWESGACSEDYAWAFHNLWANQACARKTKQIYAWAVMDGDVPPVLYRDNFDNDAAGFAPDGCASQWRIVQLGGYHGKAYEGEPEGCKDSYSSYQPDPNGNYIIETDVYMSETTTGLHGLVARAGSDSRYVFGLHGGADASFSFIKEANGESLALISEEYPLANKWHRIGISFNGSRISCFIDGKLVAGFDDPQPLRGKRFGVQAAGGKTRFDNIIIRPIGGQAEQPHDLRWVDDFSDGKADGWIPDGCQKEWAVRYADQVHGNAYAGDPSECMDSFHGSEYPMHDYLLETELLVFRENRGGWHGVIGRAVDKDNGYILALSTSTVDPQKLYLYKMAAGKPTRIHYMAYPFLENVWYRLGLEFKGEEIIIYVDGNKIWEGKDPTAPIYGSKIGLKAHGSGVMFDNVRLSS